MLLAPGGNDEQHAEILDLRASGFRGKVMSLFCEASRSFSSFDPDQTVDVTHEDTGERHIRRGLTGTSDKASRRSRRHAKRLSDSSPDAYPEIHPKKASLLLNPWRQDPDRSLTSTLCGDGLFYAAGGNGGAGGCINSARVRSVEREDDSGEVDVID
jgi:hypothetical protein